MTAIKIPVEIIITSPDLLAFGGPPRPAMEGDAASDLRVMGIFGKKPDGKPDFSVVNPIDGSFELAAGEVKFIDVGFRMDIADAGYAAFLIPRSNSSAIGVMMANTIGLVDSSYQGDICLALFNRNAPALAGASETPPLVFSKGERIGQMYLAPVVHPEWTVVQSFSRATGRGVGGFGSTGKS